MFRILVWELRRRRTALIWWTISSIGLTLLILALYPSIRDQAQQLNQVFNQLPGGIRGLKTGGAKTIDVADPIAFLNSQLFYITLPMIWIILAITRGSSLLGREEQDHTLELLLARPISRGKLLAGKAMALVSEFIAVGGCTLLAIVLLAPVFDLHVGTLKLIIATLYTIAFSCSFGLIAFTLQASNAMARRIAVAVAIFISFGGYIIASMSSLTDWLDIPNKVSPYHYFAPDKIMLGQSHTGLNIYLVGTAVLAAIVSYLGFRRRDIN